MKTHVIYGLMCPLTHKIVYVGRSRSATSRFDLHRRASIKSCTPCLREWMEKLEKNKVRQNIEMVIIETITDDNKSASKAESYWIAKLSKNHPLLNIYQMPAKKHIEPSGYGIITAKEYMKKTGNKL
jgi:hypothetical protein